MAGAAPLVRKATARDIPGVARCLARAFRDDPVMSWMFRRDDDRVERNERFFDLRLRQVLSQETIFTTEDHSGAAVWTLPERWRLDPREALATVAHLIRPMGRRLPRALRWFQEVERRHPRTPHYYLAILGTEPDRQGEGLGSATMKPILDSCDEDDIPAYLESSKERNVAFYARHGFRVLEELEAHGAPPIWLMWREPRP